MGERPYTEKQKRFMKVKTKDFSKEELDFLRVMLLPRSKYLPETEEGCFAYAREIVKDELFEKLKALIAEIKGRFGIDECVWKEGDHYARLYYKMKKAGRTFCMFTLDYDRFFLAVYFNGKEREAFEAERENFPREIIQWPYDVCMVKANGSKCVYFDIEEEKVCEAVMNIVLPFKARFYEKGAGKK